MLLGTRGNAGNANTIHDSVREFKYTSLTTEIQRTFSFIWSKFSLIVVSNRKIASYGKR